MRSAWFNTKECEFYVKSSKEMNVFVRSIHLQKCEQPYYVVYVVVYVIVYVIVYVVVYVAVHVVIYVLVYRAGSLLSYFRRIFTMSGQK